MTDSLYDDREPAWSPDGKSIAFSSDRKGAGDPSYNIWTIDLTTGALKQLTSNPNEDRLPTWSPDGARIAYARPRGDKSALWVTSLTDGDETLLKEVAGRIDAPSFGPKGELAYVVADQASSHLEVDGATGSEDENVFPFRASWTPKSGYYYVSDGKIRQRTGKSVKSIPFTAGLEVTQPSYARAKRDWDSTAPRKVLGIARPTLSPNGEKIAFIALGDLYVVSSKGGKPKNLTKDHAMDADPSRSPNGKQIAYSSDKGGGLPQIWIRDLTTGKDRQLTTMDTQPLGAAWAPDGKTIAAIDVDGRWGVAGVFTIDVATGKITRLQGSLPQPGEPSWSADGRYVAISLSKLYSLAQHIIDAGVHPIERGGVDDLQVRRAEALRSGTAEIDALEQFPGCRHLGLRDAADIAIVLVPASDLEIERPEQRDAHFRAEDRDGEFGIGRLHRALAIDVRAGAGACKVGSIIDAGDSVGIGRIDPGHTTLARVAIVAIGFAAMFDTRRDADGVVRPQAEQVGVGNLQIPQPQTGAGTPRRLDPEAVDARLAVGRGIADRRRRQAAAIEGVISVRSRLVDRGL